MTDKWVDMPETKKLKEFVAEQLKYYMDFEDKADTPAWVLGEDIMKEIFVKIERLEKEET